MFAFLDSLFKKKVKIEKIFLSEREMSLLYLIGRSRQIDGCLKLNKLVFLIQYNCFKEETLRNFEYDYTRYKSGPFDMNIYLDLRNLEARSLIFNKKQKQERIYLLTELGSFNYELIEKELPFCFKREVDKVLVSFLRKDRSYIIKKVYEVSKSKDFEIGDKMSSVFSKN